MKPFKFKTTVSSKGTIKLPFSENLAGKDIEVIIRYISNKNEVSITASDFIEEWAGFLKSQDTDADKYDYLSNKYS